MPPIHFKLTTLLASVFAAFAWPSVAQAQSSSQALTLKRVSLSSSGVGYFEYEAQVSGNAVLSLPVALDKVDDVLKSLVVYDSVGSIGGISLPGQDPISQTLKQLPFEANALNKPAALIEALRGALISVGAGMRGRIVSVNAQPATASSSQKHQVMLMTDSGLQQFMLEDAQNLQFDDPVLRQQINQALLALSNNRAKDARTVEISSLGAGSRTVRVGYVTSVPIWKNAYRINLPALTPAAGANADAQARIQGWAVIENMSGQDWSGVQLTLTAGKPVAFSQQIYRAYYNTRPQVGIDLPGNIVPQADAGTFRDTAREAGRPQAASAPVALMAAPMGKSMSRAAAPDMAMMGNAQASPVDAGLSPQLAIANDAATVQDSSTQVSYTFGLPVTVGSGRSLSIPIIQQALPASRVALYKPSVNAQFPLAALDLRNTSANGLPAGAVTLYEASPSGNDFVGDAQLAVLPANDSRYLAYALDQKISIKHQSEQSQRIARYSVKAANLITAQVQTVTNTFTVKSNHEQARDLVVEVPQYGASWLLIPPQNAAFTVLGSTQNQYRIGITAAAGETRSVRVAQENANEQAQYLAHIDSGALRTAADHAATPADSKKTLLAVLTLRASIERRQNEGAELNQKLEEIRQEQARIRENLKSVPVGSAPHTRYMQDLSRVDAEDAQVQGALKTNKASVQAAEKTLNEFVTGLR